MGYYTTITLTAFVFTEFKDKNEMLGYFEWLKYYGKNF